MTSQPVVMPCGREPAGVKVSGSPSCQRCLQWGRDCVSASPLHFRPVKSIHLKTPEGYRVKHDLRNAPRQIWVDVPSEVRFVTDNFEESEETGDQETNVERETTPISIPLIENTAIPDFELNNYARAQADQDHRSPISSRPRASPQDLAFTEPNFSSTLQAQSPSSYFSNQTHLSMEFSPLHSAERLSHHHTSPALLINGPGVAPPTRSLSQWPFRNHREAYLMHHYIVNLSLQFDSCDKHHHFGKEVPRRASHHPIIKNAIFAVSSRHLSLLADKEDKDSDEYLSECLQTLIPALEDPLGHLDENLLAAVILLRTHEEMSDNDERYHLFGATRLLNSIASFAADGGLRECASWVSLRQHIYISLTSQHPLTINLTNYRDSAVFQTSDDESWANRIIFIFASILTHVFVPEGEHLSLSQWNDLDAEVTAWDSSKPWYFTPMFVESFSPISSAAELDRSPWPDVLVSTPAQVVGLQHYYLARIILAICDPRLMRLGFDSFRLRRSSEDSVRSNLRMVVGLAVSNGHILTSMYQASHALSACGMYLTEQWEQDAAVDFLVNMNRRMGWRTAHIVQNLKQQWHT